MYNLTNMMGYGTGAGVGGITLILLWILMGLGIAALWKYIAKR